MATTKVLATNFSHNLIEEIEVEIGGQRIDRQYGHWLQVWSELTEPNATGAQAAVTANGTTAKRFRINLISK